MPPPEYFGVSNQDSGIVLASNVQLADASETRRRGLLAYEEMPPDFGLWIAPCEAVHTFWMRFPIDLVFLSRDKRVLKLVRRLRPWRISICLRAYSVLELPAGSVDRTRTTLGDRLRFTPP